MAFVTYKEWAAYRSHVAVSLFVGPVYFLVQFCIWRAVYATRGTINGLTLGQMLTYCGVAAAISYLTFDFADWNLQMLIQTGRLLPFMLRPVSHRFFALAQKVGHRLLGFWMEFVPVSLMFCFVFRIRLLPANLLWAAASIALGFLMTFLVDYSIGITGFWLTRTGGLRRMFQIMRDVLAGVFIPLTFFPGIVQKILFYLPFQFITYVPVRVFLGSYELAGVKYTVPEIVGLQALAVLAMWLVSGILWRLGMRSFTGVGA